MQFINIKDYKTGDIIKALNFGGPKCYKVSNRFVWAPEGGTSLVVSENSITLEPLGLVINNPNIWTIVSHQSPGTVNWRVTVKNLATGEEKAGVYPFKFNGNVYELECQPGTWVMASCGGYKIESSWSGKQSYQAYRLKGTNEVIKLLDITIWYDTAVWFQRTWGSISLGAARIDFNENIGSSCSLKNWYAATDYYASVKVPLYDGWASVRYYSVPFKDTDLNLKDIVVLTSITYDQYSGEYYNFNTSNVKSYIENYLIKYVNDMNSSTFPYKTNVASEAPRNGDLVYSMRIYGKLRVSYAYDPNGYDIRAELPYMPMIFLSNLYPGVIEEINNLSLEETMFRFGLNPDKLYQ